MRESIDGEAETEGKKPSLSSVALLWDYLCDMGFPEVHRAKDAH